MIQVRHLLNSLILSFFIIGSSLFSTIDYLDTTFGSSANGIVTTTINEGSIISKLKLDSTGKIVAVGNAMIDEVQNFLITKYTTSGALDTSFNSTGILTNVIGNSSNATDVVIDSTDRIIIAGTDGSNNIILLRYSSAGVLDTTFGTSGIATLTIGDGSFPNGAVIDANNNIVVAGTSIINGQPSIFIARFTSSGTLDTTFGTSSSGYTVVTGSVFYQGHSLKIDQNSKLVVGGSVSTNPGSDFLLARFNSDGNLDSTFGSGGLLQQNILGNAESAIKSITIDSSNRIVAAGFTNSGGYKFALARFTNGALDTSFGENLDGIVITDIGATAQIMSSVFDLDGKIVVTGFSDSDIATARYTANGSLDTTFGSSGILTTLVGSVSALTNGLAIQASDGRIVAGGFYIKDGVTGEVQSALLRYNKNNVDFINLTSIADNSTINTKIPSLSGTSNGTTSPQASVQVIINGSTFTTVNTDSSGNWNAGNSPVLPIGENIIRVNLIINSVTVVSHVTKFTVTDNLSEDAVFAYNSTTQTKTSNTFSTLPFDNRPVIGTWSYSSNVFTCNKAGRYYIYYVGFPGATAVSTSTAINVATMVAINGTEYVGSESNSNVDIIANINRTLSKAFIKDLVAGDTLSLNYAITGNLGTPTAGLLTNSGSTGTQHAYALVITRLG